MNTTKEILTLRNPLNEEETHDLYILPKEATIGRKWIDKLKTCLQDNKKIEKNYCWVGWPSTPRSIEYLTRKLREYVNIINNYNQSPECKWDEEYHITEYFHPSTVMTADIDVNHDIFNRLHHHFEVLQGQVWNISPWFVNASNDVRYAIRQLNNLCHEMEILIKQLRAQKHYPEVLSPAAIIGFINGPRELLEDDDYDHFTLQRGGGRVYLGYCQVGKIHWEAFIDNDDHVGHDGISGLKYVSGEVTIDFGNDSINRKTHQEKINEYKTWLTKHNLSIDDKTIGHGWLHVADIDLSRYPGKSLSEVQDILSNFLDIYKISIEENGIITHSNIYDYHWNKPDFENNQKEELSKNYDFSHVEQQ
jgi:hypothetical protein